MKKKKTLYSVHHLVPRSIKKDNSPSNLERIKHVQHRAWHNLFDVMSPCEIAQKIKDKFIPKEFDIKVSIEGGCEACPWKKKCSLRR